MAKRVVTGEGAPPKAIGSKVDLIAKLRGEKATIEKKLADAKQRLDDAEEDVRKELLAAGLTSARGKKGQVTLSTRIIPQIEDYDDLTKYIKRTGAFELLQRRLSSTAVKERWEAGKQVPGVTRFTDTVLSFTSVK